MRRLDVKMMGMTGKKIIDLAILGFSFLVTAGVAAFFFFSTGKMFNRPLPDGATEALDLKETTQGVMVPEAFKMKKITINLRSRTKRLRFLDIKMQLIPFRSDQTGYLEPRKYILRDVSIRVAGSFYPEELNNVSGKIIFESRLKENLNKILGSQIVKEIYFTHFVIQ